jgi:hypothetical protein
MVSSECSKRWLLHIHVVCRVQGSSWGSLGYVSPFWRCLCDTPTIGLGWWPHQGTCTFPFPLIQLVSFGMRMPFAEVDSWLVILVTVHFSWWKYICHFYSHASKKWRPFGVGQCLSGYRFVCISGSRLLKVRHLMFYTLGGHLHKPETRAALVVPWGTPDSTFNCDQVWPLPTTNWVLQFRKSLNQFMVVYVPDTP